MTAQNRNHAYRENQLLSYPTQHKAHLAYFVALVLFVAPQHQTFADKSKAALAAAQTALEANPAASKADIAKADAEAKVRPRALVRFGPMNRTQSRVATHPFINTRHCPYVDVKTAVTVNAWFLNPHRID